MYTNIKTSRLNIEDTFNISYKIFVNNIKFISIMSLLIFMPILILIQAIHRYTYYIYSLGIPEEHTLLIIIGVYTIGLLIYSVVICTLYSAITSCIIEIVNNNELLLKKVLKTTYRKLGKQIFTALIYTFVLIPMFLFFIIPGVYFAVSMAFFPCVIAITDKWGFAALKESRRIIKGNWLKTFAFLILIIMFSNMTNNLLSIAQGLLSWLLADSLISFLFYFVISRTIQAYFIVVFVVWVLNKYYTLQLDKDISK